MGCGPRVVLRRDVAMNRSDASRSSGPGTGNCLLKTIRGGLNLSRSLSQLRMLRVQETAERIVEKIEFSVPGIPVPQGSKRGFINPKNPKRALVVDVQHVSLRSWRRDIIDAAHAVYGGPALDCALNVGLTFGFARPLGHFKPNGDLRASAPTHMATGKDLDKLIRAVLDALEAAGIVTNDARVGGLMCFKDYIDVAGFGPRPGLQVSISER